MFRPLALLLSSLMAMAGSPRTLRVDLHHQGTATTESFSLDRVVLEPLPWPGNPAKSVDDSNLGKYRFEVRDPKSGRVLYSRGFASIMGEWQDTAEAQKRSRVFEESLRFPCPEGPVTVAYQKRNAALAFEDVWKVDVDPKDTFVDRAKPRSAGPLLKIQNHGDSAAKVDLLILGDGYTAAERPKFERDAKRLSALLFAQEPFKSHRTDFNVWGLCPPAAESGISRPSTGIHRHNPVGSTYDAFGSERYVLTFDNKAFREFASQAPYDFVEILVNGKTYGGGGIHQLYSTVASDNAFSPYVFVHEFGHHFAGLADEYYTSDVALELGKARQEPWEPNVTADPRNPKWKALLTAGLELPTPWKKAEFEAFSHGIQKERRAIRAANQPESVMEALFRREEAHESTLLGTDTYSGKVGAFEGANYEATGYYRSQEDCIMFTRDQVPFCAACRKAIEGVIWQYTAR
ncbi:MAG TPA: M64 family metallopeptidase [Holophagaceae bacterium]|nr:M64 family metallopeptidase [Holophagaceae bacterium]